MTLRQGPLTVSQAEQNDSGGHFPCHDRVHADAFPHSVGEKSSGHNPNVGLEHDDAKDPDEADPDADKSADSTASAQQEGDADADRTQMPTEEGEERAEEVDPSEAEAVVVLTAVDHGNEHHAEGMDECQGYEGAAQGESATSGQAERRDGEQDSMDDEGDVDDHMQRRIDVTVAQHLHVRHAEVTDVVGRVRIVGESGGGDRLGEEIDHGREKPADCCCDCRSGRDVTIGLSRAHPNNGRWLTANAEGPSAAQNQPTRTMHIHVGACQGRYGVQI